MVDEAGGIALTVRALAAGPKLPQQIKQRLIDLAISHLAPLAARTSRQHQEQQQRLVRRALALPRPLGHVRDAIKELAAIHARPGPRSSIRRRQGAGRRVSGNDAGEDATSGGVG